ncbi:MAG: RNA polymerase sigma factor [Mycobacteriales bacterium]
MSSYSWEGFTQAQVARHLDLPEGTVRSRTHRARQRLREVLRMHSLA